MIESISLATHVCRRNWTVYRKDFLANISPTVIDPVMFVMALGMGLGVYVAKIEGLSYVQFISAGLVASTALFTSFFESSYGFYVRMVYENVFKAMLTTPIGPHEVIVGEFMWVALKGAFMSTGVSLVLCLFQLPVNPWMLLLVPLIGAAIAIPCGAMGLLATSFVRNINQFQTVYSFIISPLFFFSGIFFPLAKSPVWLQTVGYVFPLAHGVRIAQSLFWARDVRETVFIHLPILCIQGGLLCWFAAYRIRKKLQS